MSDIAVEGEAKPAKNLFQKLINKETVPTLYAAFSALSWFSGLLGISTLAGVIWHSFDGWLNRVATAIAWLSNGLPWDIEDETIKIVIMYSGALVFFVSGIFDALKRKGIVFQNFAEIYISFMCIIVMFIAFRLKLHSIISGDEFVKSSIMILSRPSFLLYYLPSILILPVVFFISSPIIKNRFACYLWTVGSVFIIYIAYRIIKNTIGISFDYDYSVFLLWVHAPLILLSFNPKRLRQITMFGVAFVGLAAFSSVLEKVFPTLVNTHIG